MANDGTPVQATCTWVSEEPAHIGLSFSHGNFGSETQVGVSFDASTADTGAPILFVLTTPDVPGGLGALEDANCQAEFIDFDSETQSVWAEFTCEALTSFGGGDTCAVATGYFYFENCGD